MGSHPLNLALRFILELCALASVGFWGWHFTNDWFKYLLVVLTPTILAAIWGIFNVPNDPSRSGKAPVPISGIARFIIEIGIFTFAIWTLYRMGFVRLYLAFGVLVIIHYAISYDRIKWLMSQ